MKIAGGHFLHFMCLGAETLYLQHVYPAELEITEIIETTDKIIIKLKSHTHSCKCPSCGSISTQYQATYLRRVQDLPIRQWITERSGSCRKFGVVITVQWICGGNKQQVENGQAYHVRTMQPS